MFKHYLTTAINNLLGNKLYSGINIAGLAFGLAASILIALYVLDKTSYDKHWENADRIYRVNTSAWSTGGSFSLGQGTAMPVMPALQNFFSQAIETGTRFMSADSEITTGNQRFEETVNRVDRSFLDMFELEPLAGSLAEALSDPTKVALRADVAQRFFGTGESMADIIGQVLTVNYAGVSRDYEVAAIYRFPAGNTVLDLPMLTLLDTSVLPPFFNNWNARSGQSYIQLRPGVDVATVTAALMRFSDQNVDMSSMEAGPDVKPSDRLRFELQNIAAIHLNSPFDDSRAGANRTVVIAFTAIAVLVLLIGTINFTILSTAKATKRAKEVALRKTVGAGRLELIAQFLGQSFCMVLPAMLVACVLVELLLPVFEAMVGKSLQINWLAPHTLLALGVVHISVSLLGGLYPAFLLSRFRPASTLKATRLIESKGSLSLRNLLVVFQFGVSIALIIATGVIYMQVRYAMNRDPGFNRENVLVIDNLIERAEVNGRKETLKAQLQELGAVTGATLSIHQPTQKIGLATVGGFYATPGESSATQSITTLGIDADFFSTYQTEIVAGRGFSATLDQPAEIISQQPGGPAPSKVVINVSASRLLGFASPQAALDSQIRFKSPIGSETYDLTIIGVTADTNFYSMNAVPRPEVYSFSPGYTDVLSVRFEGNPQTVLAQITDIWHSVMGDAELSTSFVAQNMEAEFAQERVEAQLLVSFALLAIVIACLGLYGSASFSMDRRTKEIGIRKVMGAEVREIVALLVWQFSKPVLLANAIAWPLATWAMLKWLQRFPYQIDALVLIPLCVLAGAIALSIAWLTVVGNTLKVATTNPVYALRYE
jgi:putative ABC transport system permease protein